MVNSKDKGRTWEQTLVKLLNAGIESGKFQRVPGSGAMGTSLGEPLLNSDVKGTVKGFHKALRIEAKVGYGGSKQFTLKKEWLDKIRKEASQSFSFPVLVGRFSGSRTGVENFVVLDLDDFIYLLNYITNLDDDISELSG